jgi:novobiocin biosynthesis protein NovU/D-mycarose 3-C-methyltransferase
MTLRRRDSCRACGADLQDVLSLGEQPLANRLRRAGESSDVPRYPLTLARCIGCELAQLREVVDPAVLFADYAYVPSTSSTMRAHFEGLADWAVRHLALGPEELVIDVGSNDGLLLSAFRQHGLRVLGVEPAQNLAERAVARGVPTVCTFFDAGVAERLALEQQASLVCATNVFAHVDDIRGFMHEAFELLGPDGVFLVEVQSFADTVARVAFDMTYHEHMTYYATSPLARMCEREGVALLDVQRVATHGGSLRAVIGRPGHALARPHRVAERIAIETPFIGEAPAHRFAQGALSIRRDLRALLERLRAAGGRVAAYGAPAKATVLLNYCDLGPGDVEYVVDLNEAKQGSFIPGVDVPVVGPEHLERNPPSHLLLLAWNLADEIVHEQAGFRARGGRFVIPVPVPRVLD